MRTRRSEPAGHLSTGRGTVPPPLSVIGVAAVTGAARSRYMTGRLADSGRMHGSSRQCRSAALQLRKYSTCFI